MRWRKTLQGSRSEHEVPAKALITVLCLYSAELSECSLFLREPSVDGRSCWTSTTAENRDSGACCSRAEQRFQSLNTSLKAVILIVDDREQIMLRTPNSKTWDSVVTCNLLPRCCPVLPHLCTERPLTCLQTSAGWSLETSELTCLRPPPKESPVWSQNTLQTTSCRSVECWK